MGIDDQLSFVSTYNTERGWVFISQMIPMNKIGRSKMHGVMNAIKFYWKKVNGMIAQRGLPKSWQYAKVVSKKSKEKILKHNRIWTDFRWGNFQI